MYCARSGASDAQQGFDGAHVSVLVAHHRHVVEAIHVADRLIERLGFGQLFGATMQQADVRIGAHDGFAVHLQHQAQHAVRSRMLRAEVHRVIADFLDAHAQFSRQWSAASALAWIRSASSRITRGTSTRGSIEHGFIDHALLLGVVAHFDVADQREILAERMADETVVGKDAAQIRMTVVDDAEQVERFALEPVQARPDMHVSDGTTGRLSSSQNTRTRRRWLFRSTTNARLKRNDAAVKHRADDRPR